MSKWTSVITTAGTNLIASASGKFFNITKAVCGAGQVPVTNLAAQTQVSDYKKDLSIVSINNVDNSLKIRMQLNNNTVMTGFDLHQIGIYSKLGTTGQEVLFQIIQTDIPDVIPSNSENQYFIIDYVVNLVIGNASSVSGTIDTAAFATAGQVNAIDQKIISHQANAVIHVTSADKDAWNNKISNDGSGQFNVYDSGTSTSKDVFQVKPSNDNTIFRLNFDNSKINATTTRKSAILSNNTTATGGNNCLFGYNAGAKITSGSSNVAIGTDTMRNTIVGQMNTAVGTYALNSTDGSYNTAIGYKTLKSNTTGSNNTAQGNSALENDTTGYNNVANGNRALYQNVSGNNNVADGHEAGKSNIQGNNNTFVGTQAGYSSLGSGNVFIGYNAGYNETGDNKLRIANNAAESLVEGDFINKLFNVKGTLQVNGTPYDQGINSHTQNSNIHITTAERDKWNNSSYISGYYSGNGSTQYIDLGFVPSAVMICENEYPFSYATDYYTNVKLTMGLIVAGIGITAEQFGTYSFKQIALIVNESTHKGFKVMSQWIIYTDSGASQIFNPFNASGKMYYYIAFR